jgi:hypothetical protein
LPAGLALNAGTGTLAGTPTASGTSNFTVTVTDSASATGSRDYTLAIAIASTPRLVIRPASLPAGTMGSPYADTFVASGGTKPYSYAVVGGALPPGLVVDPATGGIAGTPQKAGEFSFTVQASDAIGRQVSETVALVVLPSASLTIGPAALPASLEGGRYQSTLSASGGASPYRYEIVAGSLPPGLSIDVATGVISGTATATGGYHFTVKATDSNGAVGTRDYSMAIDGRPDPARDAAVAAIVDSQMQMGLRFAGSQIDNVMQHLQGSRDAFGCGLHQGASINAQRQTSSDPNDPARREAAGSAVAASDAAKGDQDCGAMSRVGVWSAGSLDYSDVGENKLSTNGLVVGVEALVARNVVVGGAVGTGFDRTRVGEQGARNDAHSLELMAYGTYRTGQRLAIEAMLGYGTLDQNNRRLGAADTGVLSSRRSGRMLFGSLSLGLQLHAHRFFMAPYLRNDLIAVRLDRYRESGESPFALEFAPASQIVAALVAGSRFGYESHTAWGRISPLGRFEYRHRFASDYVQSLSYADRPETFYDLASAGDRRDVVSASAGIEAAFGRLVLGVEYGSSAADFDSFGGGVFRATVRFGF